MNKTLIITIMKKLFSILAIAFAAFAISCNKGDETVIDSKVVGSWAADTFDYHYPIATFNKNGTYVWEWGGKARLKDTGEYTVENGIIEMKISEYYEFEELILTLNFFFSVHQKLLT